MLFDWKFMFFDLKIMFFDRHSKRYVVRPMYASNFEKKTLITSLSFSLSLESSPLSSSSSSWTMQRSSPPTLVKRCAWNTSCWRAWSMVSLLRGSTTKSFLMRSFVSLVMADQAGPSMLNFAVMINRIIFSWSRCQNGGVPKNKITFICVLKKMREIDA